MRRELDFIIITPMKIFIDLLLFVLTEANYALSDHKNSRKQKQKQTDKQTWKSKCKKVKPEFLLLD